MKAPSMNRIKQTAAVLFCIGAIIHALWSLSVISSTLAPDFSIFYQTTRDLLAGTNPYLDKGLYTVYNYPIITNALYLPLAVLPYRVAQTIYVYISAIAVLGIAYMSDRLVFSRRSFSRLALIVGLVLEAFPVKFTLGMGQSNAIAFALLLGGFYAWQRKKNNFVAGILVGLAIILKPIFVFFLLFFALYNAIRVFYGVITVLSSSTILMLALGKLQILISYFAHVLMPLMSQEGRGVYYNQGIAGFAGRLPISLPLQAFLVSLFSLSLVFLLFKFSRRSSSLYAFSLFICALPLVHSLSWQHHFLILIFPFVFALRMTKTYKQFGVLIVSYLMVAGNIKNASIWNTFPTSLVLSHNFFGACLLLWYLCTNRALLLSNKKSPQHDTIKE